MRTFLNIIASTLYYGFVALLIAVGGAMLAMQTPVLGGTEIKIVRSGSMEPAIMTGGLVVVRPADVYAVGDVITFGKDTATQVPTTHRIIEKRGEGARTTYITQGDANNAPDGAPIAHRDIIGAVAFTMPYAGYILDFARQPLGFILLIAIPAAAVILDELWTIFRELAKRRKGAGARIEDEEESDDERAEEDESYDEDEHGEAVSRGDGRPYHTTPQPVHASALSPNTRSASSAAPGLVASSAEHAPPTRGRVSSPYVTVIPPRTHAQPQRATTQRAHPDVSFDGIINLRYARR